MSEAAIEIAKSVFKAHPKAQKVLVTTDGQAFLPEAHGHAKDYCRRTGNEISTIKRTDVMKEAQRPAVNWADMTIAEVQSFVEKVHDVSVLEQGLEKVDTKGGKAAIENRLNELDNASE